MKFFNSKIFRVFLIVALFFWIVPNTKKAMALGACNLISWSVSPGTVSYGNQLVTINWSSSDCVNETITRNDGLVLYSGAGNYSQSVTDTSVTKSVQYTFVGDCDAADGGPGCVTAYASVRAASGGIGVSANHSTSWLTRGKIQNPCSSLCSGTSGNYSIDYSSDTTAVNQYTILPQGSTLNSSSCNSATCDLTSGGSISWNLAVASTSTINVHLNFNGGADNGSMSGSSYSANGSSYTSSTSFTCNVGSSYTITAPATATVSGSQSYTNNTLQTVTCGSSPIGVNINYTSIAVLKVQ